MAVRTEAKGKRMPLPDSPITNGRRENTRSGQREARRARPGTIFEVSPQGVTTGIDPTVIFQANQGEAVLFDKKTKLFEEGDELKNVFYITSGLVALKRSAPDGREAIIDLVKPGDIVGWDVFDNKIASTQAVALEEGSAIQIPVENLLEMMNKRGS